MRRIVLAMCALGLLSGVLLGPGVELAEAQTFKDVSSGDWYYTAVEQLSAAGVVNGFADGSFRPYDSVTRAQFASMLARAVRPPQVYQEPFNDVYSVDWFFGSVASLYQAGLIAGTSGTTFSPNLTIDRQQAATLMTRALEYTLARQAEDEGEGGAPQGDEGDGSTSGLAGVATGPSSDVAAMSTPEAAGEATPPTSSTAPSTEAAEPGDAATPADGTSQEETTAPSGGTDSPPADAAAATTDPAGDASVGSPTADTVVPPAPATVESQASEAARATAPALAVAPADLALAEDQIEAWLAGFKDRGFIAPAHRLGTASAYRFSIVSGSADGRFYPLFGLTRAQAAALIHRTLYQPLQERPAPPAPVPAESTYPALKRGSTGSLVSYIESRLSALKYDVGQIDGVYDEALRDAVRAFQKVEGLSRDGEVGPQVWGRIGSARIPAPRYSTGGNRVEIDLSRQVLFLVNGGNIVKILPVSTGTSGWNTPTGSYRIQRKLPYWRKSALGLLYMPSYFVGGIAIHGSYSIPPYPASHGCVRVPVWATNALYYQLPVGMPVAVYY